MKNPKTPFEHMLKALGQEFTIVRTNTKVNGFRHCDEHNKRNFIGFNCNIDVAVGDCILDCYDNRLHVDELVTEYWIGSKPHYNKAYYTTVYI